MSKMDALRAMREAGHEQAMARRAKRAAAPTAQPTPGRPSGGGQADPGSPEPAADG